VSMNSRDQASEININQASMEIIIQVSMIIFKQSSHYCSPPRTWGMEEIQQLKSQTEHGRKKQIS
jgi:hypothetical protein